MSVGIEFECPHCARVTRVPAELAGKQGRCGGCRKILEVPDPDLQDAGRRTAHLREEDRVGFELADSTTANGVPLPPDSANDASTAPAQGSLAGETPAWDNGRVPTLMWVALFLGPILPPFPLAFGFYGIGKGHVSRVRELAAFGWLGLVEILLIWMIYSLRSYGLFWLPLIGIVITLAVAGVHVKWIAKHPSRDAMAG